jgi:DNA-binding transcriptional regulator YhcF (GntR family)
MTEPTTRSAISAEAVKDAIFQRIASGVYAVGERLPSVRALADELGCHRNTAHRAYQLLTELGAIAPAAGGRGFVVAEVGEGESRDKLKRYLSAQAKQLIWQGFAAGLSPDELTAVLSQALAEVCGARRVRLGFFECNRQDSQEMGGRLSEALGDEVYCGLLSELTDALRVERRFDLILTTFHHLSWVLSTLASCQHKVIGIDTRLAPEALLELARLPAGSLGVVATLPETARMLHHTICSYAPERDVTAVAIDDAALVRRVARSCDYLLATHTCAEAVAELSGRQPEVVLHFQIDAQSLQFVAQRIRELQAASAPELRWR